jgi:predicted lipoprotein with Yx(FWY)xxD motif
MRKLIGGAALFAALALALAACGGNTSSSGSSGSAAQSQPAQASGAGVLKATTTPLGTVLTDGTGRTLYVLTKDKNGASSCTGDCASTWPPFTASASAGSGVDGSLLGTTKRADGSMQVTYKNHPLYYFAGDSGAGQTNGQGVGGVWFVIGPSGDPITAKASSGSGSGSGGGGGGGYGAPPSTSRY